MAAAVDHFALFGLPQRYDIDLTVLEQHYRELQSKVHPDKHAHLGASQKLQSMQQATNANEALETLKSPLKRAMYLLELAGHEIAVENNTAMPPEFLMAQMELREAVSDARSAKDEAALDDLRGELRQRMAQEYVALGETLDQLNDHSAAAEQVRQLMFQQKLLHDIDDALEAIDA